MHILEKWQVVAAKGKVKLVSIAKQSEHEREQGKP